MRAIPILTSAICLFVATTSSAQPTIDCKSALAPKVDPKTYSDTCRAQAAEARAKAGQAAVAAANVFDSRTTVAAANFANVPTWSDADILAEFASTRDTRYMTTPDRPGFLRRISWMYPNDGCFARAEQVNVRVSQAGKPKPYKLFVFGAFERGADLHVYTNNSSTGEVYWQYHVVPVVKNSAGEPIVFDAALSPCRPLPWKEWLLLMASNLSFYDNLAANNGITVAGPSSYHPYSLVAGEPDHSAESLNDQTQFYLPFEWTRQTELGRDPNVVLGSTPPWSGWACLAPTVVSANASVAAGATTTVTAGCPFATLAVGGSFARDNTSFAISKNARSGNGWQVIGKNTGSTIQALKASAVCLIGAPINASVSSIQGNVVSVSNNSNATSTASCPAGQLVGGGYTTTLGTSSVMRIYNNNRTTSTSSTWQVSAQNNTGSSKSVTSFAYCLQNTSFTFRQVSTALDSSGTAGAVCSGAHTVGGGFGFPRLTNYTVLSQWLVRRSAWVLQMTPAPANGDPNALSFGECLATP